MNEKDYTSQLRRTVLSIILGLLTSSFLFWPFYHNLKQDIEIKNKSDEGIIGTMSPEIDSIEKYLRPLSTTTVTFLEKMKFFIPVERHKICISNKNKFYTLLVVKDTWLQSDDIAAQGYWRDQGIGDMQLVLNYSSASPTVISAKVDQKTCVNVDPEEIKQLTSAGFSYTIRKSNLVYRNEKIPGGALRIPLGYVINLDNTRAYTIVQWKEFLISIILISIGWYQMLKKLPQKWFQRSETK